MPDEVLIVVMAVMAIGAVWSWAKSSIGQKDWRGISLPLKFIISLVALLMIIIVAIAVKFMNNLKQCLGSKNPKRWLVTDEIG
jgi:hypothetical protein